MYEEQKRGLFLAIIVVTILIAFTYSVVKSAEIPYTSIAEDVTTGERIEADHVLDIYKILTRRLRYDDLYIPHDSIDVSTMSSMIHDSVTTVKSHLDNVHTKLDEMRGDVDVVYDSVMTPVYGDDDVREVFTGGSGISISGGTISFTYDIFEEDAVYSELRAQSTTKADVGLANVDNVSMFSMDWDSLAIAKKDISKSDVDLGRVDNISSDSIIVNARKAMQASDVDLDSVDNMSSDSIIVQARKAITANDVGLDSVANADLDAIKEYVFSSSDPKTSNDGYEESSTVQLTNGNEGKIYFGDVVYIAATGTVDFPKATNTSSLPVMYMCVSDSVSSGAGGTFLRNGIVTDTSWTWTSGGEVYVTTTGTTGNTLTQTPPSAGGTYIQIVGVAINEDVIDFCPDLTIVEN